MALVDELYISAVWTPSDVRGSNTAGTPIISAELAGDGEEISGDYVITISGRAGSTGTVTVTAEANNPFAGKVVTGVTMDDATATDLVIPGVSIIFDNASANGNTAHIVVGNPYGAFDASGVDAGVPTDGVRHRVTNSGTSDVASAVAKLLPQAVSYRKTGHVFDYIKPFAEGATEKTAGGGSDQVVPYALSISSVSGSGGSKVATLSVDGVALPADSLLDITLNTTHSGTGIKAISPGYPYRVVSGPLTGLGFALSASCANTNVDNVLIFPSRYVQIAPDVTGVEGTYATTDVDLTESGEATGVITASGVAYFWSRFLVPSSAGNESNPYPCNICLQGSQSSAAGWGA